MFLVGDPELNLHLPLLLGWGTTQIIFVASFSGAPWDTRLIRDQFRLNRLGGVKGWHQPTNQPTNQDEAATSHMCWCMFLIELVWSVNLGRKVIEASQGDQSIAIGDHCQEQADDTLEQKAQDRVSE